MSKHALPEIVAPAAPQLSLADLGNATAGAAPSTDPATPAPKRGRGRPPGTGKKKSGWERKGDLTSAEFHASKQELAAQLRDARTKLAAYESGPTPPAAGAAVTGEVRNGSPPSDALREKMVRQVAALLTLAALVVFEVIAKWRGKEWELSDERAGDLGELWAEWAIYKLPAELTPEQLALYAAIGGTGGIALAKWQAEARARAAQPKAVEVPAGPRPSPAARPEEVPRWGASRS